jgi:3-oxoadipate enol-lactonase
MPELEINGYRTNVEEFGAGPPVVLIHGLGGRSTETWRHLIGPLSQSYRVVVYDLRGAGHSEVTPGPYTIDLLAADLDALIGQLGIGPAALVGHSMGAATALLEAVLHPENVRAVVAIGAAVAPTDEQRGMLAGWADQAEAEGLGAGLAQGMALGGTAPSFHEARPEEVERLAALIGATAPQGYAALCRAVSTIDLEARLDRIAVPVLFVAGEFDLVASPAVSRRFASHIPGATVLDLDDTGHHIEWEKPEILLEAIERFLQPTASAA